MLLVNFFPLYTILKKITKTCFFQYCGLQIPLQKSFYCYTPKLYSEDIKDRYLDLTLFMKQKIRMNNKIINIV